MELLKISTVEHFLTDCVRERSEVWRKQLGSSSSVWAMSLAQDDSGPALSCLLGLFTTLHSPSPSTMARFGGGKRSGC